MLDLVPSSAGRVKMQKNSLKSTHMIHFLLIREFKHWFDIHIDFTGV